MRRSSFLALLLDAAVLIPLALCARSSVDGAPATAAQVLHYLPFPAGVEYAVFQGNDQGPTHSDQWNKYAYDFSPMAIGSDVCASADGVVTFVKEDAKGPTDDVNDNNEVSILHADGTVSIYVHLQQNGALVEIDQVVFAGDVIGKSGDTGKAGGPHLHWCLKEANRLGVAIPSKFEDVPGSGVPKTGDRVTSQNLAVRPVVDAMKRLDAAYERAKRLGCLESVIPSLTALAKPAPPPDIAALLAKFARREDAKRTFVEQRDALIAKHRADADATLESLAKAREDARFDEAVALATFGRLEYSTIPTVVAKFQAALVELGKEPGYAKVAYALGPRLAWRRDLMRAFDLEAKARATAASGKKGGWKTVLGIYDGLVSRAPNAESKATLSEYVAPLKTAFGKAE